MMQYLSWGFLPPGAIHGLMITLLLIFCWVWQWNDL